MEQNSRLQVFTKKDIPILLGWLEGTDARFLRQFSGPRYSWPLSGEQIERELEEREKTSRQYFLYITEDTGSPLGFCQLLDINRIPGKTKIGGVMVHPERRGQGIGQAMIRDLMDLGMEAYGLNCYALSVYDFNGSARRCYEQLGFREVEPYVQQVEELGESWPGVIMQRDFIV